MLRHAFRRLLWVIPSVAGVSIVAFLVLSWIPNPAAQPGAEEAGAVAEEARRQGYSHLPLFVNPQPEDVRTRVEQAVRDVAGTPAGSEAAERGGRELRRLGGAGLPYLLPKLDALPPEARIAVGQALGPVAVRLGLEDRGELADPQRVVLFWTRFWETRGVEFRTATARSTLRRYARYGSEARAEELRILDTFLLGVLMEELPLPTNRAEVTTARRLIDLAAHATARADRIAESATTVEAAACVTRWQHWWAAYRSDYVPLVGVARVGAVVLETRFGKWAWEAVFDRFGPDASGRPVLDELLARGRISLAVLLLAVALAYGAAVALGTFGALRRGGTADRAIGLAVLFPHALSPVALGMLGVALGWRSPAPQGEAPLAALVGAAALLALALLADPTRHQRAALLPVLTRDYVRAAVARGAGPWRAALGHGLRHALLPLCARVSLDLPAALTSVFVLERALGLPGLGEHTVAAVGRGDVRWLMALTVFAAAWAVAALVLSDVAVAALDPRLRPALLQPRRRRA